MNISMINSLVGMHALQQKIDSVANNISNINTTGYKSREVYFRDILTSRINQPDAFKLDGRITPMGLDKGYGSRTSLTLANFSQGQRMETGIPTDFMLSGNKIFFTILPAGKDIYDEKAVRYTKDGHFQLDANRNLVTDNGDFVLNTDNERIQIPESAKFNVDANGHIVVKYNNRSTEELGALKITRIKVPQALEQIGNSLYKIPDELANNGIKITDDEYDIAQSKENDAVYQGSLEGSNTDLAKEMVQLNETQRSYQFLSKGLTISDQMLGIANNLNR